MLCFLRLAARALNTPEVPSLSAHSNNSGLRNSANLVNLEGFLGLRITCRNGPEQHLVLSKAGSEGSEHPWSVLFVRAQHYFWVGNGADEGRVQGAAADTLNNVWKCGSYKALKLLSCPVACSQ